MVLLVLYVLFQGILIDTDSGNEIASCPETTFGDFLVLLLDPFLLLKTYLSVLPRPRKQSVLVGW